MGINVLLVFRYFYKPHIKEVSKYWGPFYVGAGKKVPWFELNVIGWLARVRWERDICDWMKNTRDSASIGWIFRLNRKQRSGAHIQYFFAHRKTWQDWSFSLFFKIPFCLTF